MGIQAVLNKNSLKEIKCILIKYKEYKGAEFIALNFFNNYKKSFRKLNKAEKIIFKTELGELLNYKYSQNLESVNN